MMILVTVGTHYKQFNRLIEAMDQIAGEIEEQVVMQTGSSDYQVKNSVHFPFASYENIVRYFDQARVIVAQAGAGTVLDVLSTGKPLIIVPRLKRYDEIIDDQQLELAGVLEQNKWAIVVHNTSQLCVALDLLRTQTVNGFHTNGKLINFLKSWLSNLKI